jgi:hypothetical protein
LKKKLNVLVKTIEDKQECESVLEFLNKHQPIYVFTRKSGGFSLNPIEREIRERDDISNISSELYIFGLLGFDHAIKIRDRKMSWKTISTITIAGVLQLAVGIAMNRHLRRITTNPGVGGIGDILFIIKNLRRNQVPTMSEYLRHKLKQVAQDSSKPISPKDVAESWLVNPKQNHENETNFLEQIKNQRRSVTPLEDSSTTSVASFDTNNLLHLMNQGLARLNGELDRHCHLCGIKIQKEIRKVVDKNSNAIKESLSHLQRLHGLEEAQRLVNEKLYGLTTGCLERIQERYSEVLAKVDDTINSAFSPVNETLGREKDMAGILTEIVADLANQIVRAVDLDMEIRHLVVENIWKFHSELETLITSQNCDIEEHEMTVDFENKVMTDVKSEMAETLDKTIAFLAQQLTARVTNNVTMFGNSLLDLLQNEGNDYHSKEVKRKRRKFRIRFHSSNCILM